jgi:hypothetical protein
MRRPVPLALILLRKARATDRPEPGGLELTRFRGHLIVGEERSVHDAKEPSTVPARVSGAAR